MEKAKFDEIEEDLTRLFMLGFVRFKSLSPELQEVATNMMAIIRSEQSDEDERRMAMNTLRSTLWDSDKIPAGSKK